MTNSTAMQVDSPVGLSVTRLAASIPETVDSSYLLAVVQIPLYRTASGQLFAEQLWGRDLLRHLEYLSAFLIACPCLNQEPPKDAICLDLAANGIEVIDLPSQSSAFQSIRFMPQIVGALWKAVKRAEIVHTSIAGWPIPMGWIVTPIALWQRKLIVIVVESAPWRLKPGIPADWKSRLRSYFQERVGCWLIAKSDIPIFTQDAYRKSMMGSAAARGHVIPASWIDEVDVISDEVAERLWEKKRSAEDAQLRILFAGRLTADKGVPILLRAMRLLSGESQQIELDILGEGPLEAECKAESQVHSGSTVVRMLGTVAYGAPLFALLREYHAVVVPSIADEQPRIVFDAYSQGVPLLASDTAGLRSCIHEGETGLFCAPGDAGALAKLLQYAAQNREELYRLGLNSLQSARAMTHQRMHSNRAELIRGLIGRSA